jgi:hypothetical protein
MRGSVIGSRAEKRREVWSPTILLPESALGPQFPESRSCSVRRISSGLQSCFDLCIIETIAQHDMQQDELFRSSYANMKRVTENSYIDP